MVNKTAAMAVASGELGGVLPLASLNHISVVCRSVEKSLNFYMHVLGFNPIRRPGSFDFSGAWLFNYGIGIHLLQSEHPDSLPEKTEINPKDNHISFQASLAGNGARKVKVREHGCGGAAAEGVGHPIHQAVRGGGRHLRGPNLFPRP